MAVILVLIILVLALFTETTGCCSPAVLLPGAICVTFVAILVVVVIFTTLPIVLFNFQTTTIGCLLLPIALLLNLSMIVWFLFIGG